MIVRCLFSACPLERKCALYTLAVRSVGKRLESDRCSGLLNPSFCEKELALIPGFIKAREIDKQGIVFPSCRV